MRILASIVALGLALATPVEAAMLAKFDIRVALNAQSKARHFPKVTSASNFDTNSLQQLLLDGVKLVQQPDDVVVVNSVTVD